VTLPRLKNTSISIAGQQGDGSCASRGSFNRIWRSKVG
jgi:hypothetical protein